MTPMPSETTAIHTRILKCDLVVEDCRSYWMRATPGARCETETAYSEYWFGARSSNRVRVLLENMRARHAAFPESLAVLHRWPQMSPDIRRLIAHWHLQLADPLYRRFTAEYLDDRRQSTRPTVTRDAVMDWVTEQGSPHWTLTTRLQFASKLLSSAYAAGLLAGNRDPRVLALPHVPDLALGYLLHLLHGLEFQGSTLDNPYLRGVGISPNMLMERLRSLPSPRASSQDEGLHWVYPTLTAWADAALPFMEEA